MRISRNAVVPVMLGLIFISVLTAALTFFTAATEFHRFDHLGHPMPHVAGEFRSVYAAAWLLPVIALVISIVLLRAPDRTVAQIAWSVTAVAVMTSSWAAFAFISYYILHVASNYYL